jgi:cob(I)alamin adenosyltransferase
MVVLDEINVASSLGLISTEDVLTLIKAKPRELHLVLTGRGAPAEVVDRADLVTEMKMVKHPYYEGKSPRKGIEF